jgi:phosphatidylglycerophosphate synthase
MIDEPFRRWLARSAAAPAQWMHRLGLSPNAVTLAATVLGVTAAVVVSRGLFVTGLTLWLVGRILDGYDGLLARLSGKASLFGGFLDITLDMLADQWLWLIVLVGYVMAITTTLALSSLLERADRTLGGDRSLQFTPGIAEGGETTVLYSAIALLPAWSRPLLAVWIVVLTLTALGRFRLAARLLR